MGNKLLNGSMRRIAYNVDNMKRQGLSAKLYQPAQMMNSSTQYNSATQPCCFIFDVMGWRFN